MLDVLPTAPEAVVVNVSQLFYHTVWPHGCNLSDFIACIQAASHGKSVIRVLSDDTNVFALLVYRVYQAGLQCMDGTGLDINVTCAN